MDEEDVRFFQNTYVLQFGIFSMFFHRISYFFFPEKYRLKFSQTIASKHLKFLPNF